MFGNEIRKYFKRFKCLIGTKKFKCFRGVFARDTLPERVKLPMGLIANTDNISEPGTHWIAIHIDEYGIGEYFDSYGRPPLHVEFEKFLINNCPNGFLVNRINLQCNTCVTCGEYANTYLVTRLKGGYYADYISMYYYNRNVNDFLVKFYNFIYDVIF